MPRTPALLLTLLLALAPGAPRAQERFSPFVPSDQENVERMLKLAQLRDDDVVVDLGSGDGRIVLTAARLNRKLRGRGVDVNAELVMESNEAAQARGVADRVRFHHQNAFDAELGDATVITMWLWPEMQRLLRPVILARARPGTRIVTNLWDMGDAWRPDAEDFDGPRVALWVVPARAAGYWSWTLEFEGRRVPYAAVIEQHFQRAEGVVRSGNRREVLHDVSLRGEEFAFTLGMTLERTGYVRHRFRGKVRGDVIEGTARLTLPPHHERIHTLPWRATRTADSAYFAPTGTDVPQ